MKRLAIFAHHDREGRVRPYVEHQLRALREVASRVVFVSNATLGSEARARAAALSDRVLERDNLGFDFGMWRDAIASEPLGDCDALVLANSSVLGPFRALPAMFAQMREHDFWGATDSTEHGWHVQSYFVVLDKRVLASQAFARFWPSVLDYADKAQVIRSYELGLSAYLVQHGFRGGAVVPVAHAQQALERDRSRLPWSSPPSLAERSGLTAAPETYLELEAPFVKLVSLEDLARHRTLDRLYALAQQSGYPREALDALLSDATLP